MLTFRRERGERADAAPDGRSAAGGRREMAATALETRSVACTAPIVLASASPRRADLLRAAGIAFDVHPADIDERVRDRETPEAYVRRLSHDKAIAVHARARDRVVLAADTIVVVDGQILGKPEHARDASRMLR